MMIFVKLPGECAETIFHKNLPGKEYLEVIRGDVEHHPPTPEQNAEAQKAFGNLPNVAAVVPLEYRQYYDILFQGAGQTTPILVGRLSSAFESPQAPADFWHFGDAIKLKDKIFFVIMSGETAGIYSFSTDGRDKNTRIRDLKAPGMKGGFASKVKFANSIQLGQSQTGDLKATVRGRNGDLSVWLFSQSEWIKSPDPTFKLLSKKFSINGKDWLLELSMGYKENFKVSADNPRLANGFQVLLSKTPLSPGGGQKELPVTIWRLFRPNQNGSMPNGTVSEDHWSADAVIDPASNLIYLAMANGKFPWVQIFDLSGKPLEGGVDLYNTAIEQSYVQYYDLSYRLFRPYKEKEKDFAPIDSLSLQKNGNILEITTANHSRTTHETWQISLVDLLDRTWKKVEVSADR